MKKKEKEKTNMYYLIKMLDICYVSNLYLFLGVMSSAIISRYIFIPYDENRLYIVNLLFLIFFVSVISIFVFVIRNLIKFYIPSPFDGVAGFKHKSLKEINGNVILAFAFLIYLTSNLREYSHMLYNYILN